jgi:hypothetical protein
MSLILEANKRDVDFYSRIFVRLKRLDHSHGLRILRFPNVFYDLGMYFHLSKDETKIVLSELSKRGLIQLVPFNGIKILSSEGYGNGEEPISR